MQLWNIKFVLQNLRDFFIFENSKIFGKTDVLRVHLIQYLSCIFSFSLPPSMRKSEGFVFLKKRWERWILKYLTKLLLQILLQTKPFRKMASRKEKHQIRLIFLPWAKFPCHKISRISKFTNRFQSMLGLKFAKSLMSLEDQNSTICLVV